MRLVKSKNANINYLAKIIYISDFHPHPDKEVNKLKCAYKFQSTPKILIIQLKVFNIKLLKI